MDRDAFVGGVAPRAIALALSVAFVAWFTRFVLPGLGFGGIVLAPGSAAVAVASVPLSLAAWRYGARVLALSFPALLAGGVALLAAAAGTSPGDVAASLLVVLFLLLFWMAVPLLAGSLAADYLGIPLRFVVAAWPLAPAAGVGAAFLLGFSPFSAYAALVAASVPWLLGTAFAAAAGEAGGGGYRRAAVLVAAALAVAAAVFVVGSYTGAAGAERGIVQDLNRETPYAFSTEEDAEFRVDVTRLRGPRGRLAASASAPLRSSVHGWYFRGDEEAVDRLLREEPVAGEIYYRLFSGAMDAQRPGDAKRLSFSLDLGAVTVTRGFPSDGGNVSAAYRRALRLHRGAEASGDPRAAVLRDLRRNGSFRVDDDVLVTTEVGARVEQGELRDVSAEVRVAPFRTPPRPGPGGERDFVGPEAETRAERVEVSVVAPDGDETEHGARLIDPEDRGRAVTVARLETPMEGRYSVELRYVRGGEVVDAAAVDVEGWAGRGLMGEVE